MATMLLVVHDACAIFLHFFLCIYFRRASNTKETLPKFFQDFYKSFECKIVSHNDGEACWIFGFNVLIFSQNLPVDFFL